MSLEAFADRLKPAGLLYVNVYPYRIVSGSVQLCLLRRRDDVVLPSVWQPVSGKLRPLESYTQAFRRQVAEKTGQSPSRLFSLSTVTTYFDVLYDTVMLVPCAAAELKDPGLVLDEGLHTAGKWVPLNEFVALVPFRNQHVAAEELVRCVSATSLPPECTELGGQ